MNIWAMDKDLSIKQLLIMLDTELASLNRFVNNSLATDDKAVFLVHPESPGMRAYVYTLGQAPDRYGVQLEFPPENGPVMLMETYENLRYPALKDILMVHLDLWQSDVE